MTSQDLFEYRKKHDAKLIQMILKQKPNGNGVKIEFNMDFGDCEVVMVQKTN